VTQHISFATVVSAVENVKGEQWEAFRPRNRCPKRLDALGGHLSSE
jgi:hypothetical protein